MLRSAVVSRDVELVPGKGYGSIWKLVDSSRLAVRCPTTEDPGKRYMIRAKSSEKSKNSNFGPISTMQINRKNRLKRRRKYRNIERRPREMDSRIIVLSEFENPVIRSSIVGVPRKREMDGPHPAKSSVETIVIRRIAINKKVEEQRYSRSEGKVGQESDEPRAADKCWKERKGTACAQQKREDKFHDIK